MSVQQNHYMMLGAKFGYNEFHQRMSEILGTDEGADESWDYLDVYHDSAFKGIHHHNGICIISDGMSGEYVYVGHIIQKSDNYGGLGDYKNPTETPSAHEVQEAITRELGFENLHIAIHSFTHYR